jgi:hypothetical protein
MPMSHTAQGSYALRARNDGSEASRDECLSKLVPIGQEMLWRTLITRCLGVNVRVEPSYGARGPVAHLNYCE